MGFMGGMEELEIAIVGGGICGLSMALALHRKGMTSVVLERSETLRTTGTGISILTNGWRALDLLGVASKLRPTAISILRLWDIDLVSGKRRPAPLSMGEARNVRRSDLIKALADELPPDTIRFGCEIPSVNWDTMSSLPILHLSNGRPIRAKILIGCDGANSVVANFLGLQPKNIFSSGAVRGFTYYPSGHGLPPELVRMKKDKVTCGKVPVDNQLVFWFVISKYPEDAKVAKDPELIRQFALESIRGFPAERIDMIKNCDLTSLSVAHLRYRAPWDILLGKFRKGSVTVAGDAMHIMGPFVGQGGSAAMEDSIVLARCLSRKLLIRGQKRKQIVVKEMEEALDEYVRERRMRLVWLSTQSYLTGLLLESSSMVVKILALIFMLALFRNPIYHTAYDCWAFEK